MSNVIKNAEASSREFVETARENARRVWLASLGAGVRLNEESAELFRDLVSEGEKFQTEQRERIEALATEVRTTAFDAAEDMRVRAESLGRNAFQMFGDSVQWGLRQAERNPILRPGAKTLTSVLETVSSRLATEVDLEAGVVHQTDKFGEPRALAEVHGLSKSMIGKLEKHGIEDTAQLLGATATAADRRRLAKTLRVTEKTILKVANRADLARIKGIAGVYAELLEYAGVDTVVELATRNARNLRKTLEEVNAEWEITGRLPSIKVLTGWVEQAAALPRVLNY